DGYAAHPQLPNDLGLLWLIDLDPTGPRRIRALPLALEVCFYATGISCRDGVDTATAAATVRTVRNRGRARRRRFDRAARTTSSRLVRNPSAPPPRRFRQRPQTAPGDPIHPRPPSSRAIRRPGAQVDRMPIPSRNPIPR